jgi:protein RecA
MAKKTKEEEKPKTADDRDAQLSAYFKQAEKNYGKGSVQFAIDHGHENMPRVTTGILPLDVSLGGGLPIGRLSMFYGQKACLDSETFIQYEIRTKDGKVQNHKGGTIELLFNRFNNIPRKGKGSYQRESSVDSDFFVQSVDENDRTFMNKIVGVVDAGAQECFELTTESGNKIIATAKHKFFNGTSYVMLGDLSIGDTVTVSRRNKPTCNESPKLSRKYISVKHHPYASDYSVTPISERTVNIKTYTYCRLIRSRATVEAYMNGLSFDQYIDRLNNGNLGGLKFLHTNQHVHHIDEDFLNDSLSNLLVIDPSSHGSLHAEERKLGRGYAHEVTVASIRSVGHRRTFDIQMLAPYNNFIAQDFIVHNSSKTTCFLRAAGRAQRMCSNCWTPAFPIWKVDVSGLKPQCDCGDYRKVNIAWLDVEGVWDEVWSRRFLDVEKIVFSSPENGEHASDIADSLLRSGAVDIIVIDSIAFMTPMAEVERSASEPTMGTQARLLGNMFRKLVSGTNAVSQRDERRPTIWFTNQIRNKIGVMFGSPEVPAGGLAPGFAASTETRMSSSKYEEDKETKLISAVQMKFRNEKNKTGVAKMEGEYKLVLHDTKLKKLGDVIDEDYAMKMGQQTGLIQTGQGRTPTVWNGKEFERRALLEEYWMTNRDEYEAFKIKLMEHIRSFTIEQEPSL